MQVTQMDNVWHQPSASPADESVKLAQARIKAETDAIKSGAMKPNFTQIGNIAGDAAYAASNAVLPANQVAKKTISGLISNPSPGVYGDSSLTDSLLQPTKAYRKGTTRVKDKTGKGSPKKDTVPAMLAQDEAVLNAGAANMLGRKRIADLNKQGLEAIGMQGAEPEFKGGRVHAYGGVDFNDPEMVRQAQNMEMQRRLSAAPRMPVSSPSVAQPKPSIASMQRPPVYSVTEMGEPYSREELAKNAERARIAQAAQANAASVRSAQSATNAVKPSIAGRIVGVGGKVLRTAMSAPVAGITAMLESANAGAAGDDLEFAPGGRFDPKMNPPAKNIASLAPAQPQQQPQSQGEVVNTKWAGPDRAAQAKQLDDMSKAYLNAPVNKRTTDMSNADFAARGMGDIAKLVGKDGKVTYTNVGNQNKFNNEEAQARTTAYKAGEQARAESIAAQMATPQDVEKQAAQFALGQGKKIADLQAQYMAEQGADQRATIADNIGMMTGKDRKSAERKGFDAAYTETKDIDGNIVKTPMIYSKDTGDEKKSSVQVENPAYSDAKRAIATGKISKEEANKRLVAAGLKPIA